MGNPDSKKAIQQLRTKVQKGLGATLYDLFAPQFQRLENGDPQQDEAFEAISEMVKARPKIIADYNELAEIMNRNIKPGGRDVFPIIPQVAVEQTKIYVKPDEANSEVSDPLQDDSSSLLDGTNVSQEDETSTTESSTEVSSGSDVDMGESEEQINGDQSPDSPSPAKGTDKFHKSDGSEISDAQAEGQASPEQAHHLAEQLVLEPGASDDEASHIIINDLLQQIRQDLGRNGNVYEYYYDRITMGEADSSSCKTMMRNLVLRNPTVIDHHNRLAARLNESVHDGNEVFPIVSRPHRNFSNGRPASTTSEQPARYETSAIDIRGMQSTYHATDEPMAATRSSSDWESLPSDDPDTPPTEERRASPGAGAFLVAEDAAQSDLFDANFVRVAPSRFGNSRSDQENVLPPGVTIDAWGDYQHQRSEPELDDMFGMTQDELDRLIVSLDESDRAMGEMDFSQFINNL